MLSVSPGDFLLESWSSLAGVGSRAPRDEPLGYLKLKLVAIARARGWNASDSGAGGNPRDLEAVRAHMQHSKLLGFDGCAVLYPSHVAVANEVFSPTASELTWANETIAETKRAHRSRASGGGGRWTGSLATPLRVRLSAARLRGGRADRATEYTVEVLP